MKNEQPLPRYFQVLNRDLTECHEIDSETGEVVYSTRIPESKITEDVHTPIPSLFPGALESLRSTDESFGDEYEEWTSGEGNPLIGKTVRPPEESYALSVLRSYLPGFLDAEESVDPYRENTSRTLVDGGESKWSLNDKRAAVLMAERLGIRKTAKKLGIPESTLRGWIKAEASYKENTSRTPAGRPKGQRSDKPCMGCGKPTRTHVDHKPLCRSCYVGSEDYQRDRRQFASDVMALKRVMGA